jgi:hypothetical protein
MPVMVTLELEFWEKAFLAALAAGRTAPDAAHLADEASRLRRKWQADGV